MKIGVSACLLGKNVKYNGKNNFSPELVEKLKDAEIIDICPEVLGGLSVPRDPAEIVDGEVVTNKGVSVDYEFRNGAKKALDIIKKEKVDLVVLQSRSPSCGKGKIYDGTFSSKLIDGDGIFVRLLEENSIKVLDVVDFIDSFRYLLLMLKKYPLFGRINN